MSQIHSGWPNVADRTTDGRVVLIRRHEGLEGKSKEKGYEFCLSLTPAPAHAGLHSQQKELRNIFDRVAVIAPRKLL